MELREQVSSMHREMMRLLDVMNTERTEFPEGSLERKRTKYNIYYCARKKLNGKSKVKIINDDRKLIRAYLKKKQHKILLPVVRKNLLAADRFLRDYRPVNEISGKVRAQFAELPDEYFDFTWESEEWADGYNQPMNYYKEGLCHRSADGGYCRSKNEVIIRNCLFQQHLSYKYEAELILEGITFHPDFTVMRNHDAKLFYWEHCGMVNDSGKIRSHQEKLEVYERHGIVPWDNLIVTYDQPDGGINAKLIDGIIHAVFL